MNMSHLRIVFLTLTIVGVALPYVILVPFIAEHGLNLKLIVQEITDNTMAAFGWADIIISAIVLLVAAFALGVVRLRQAVVVTLLTCCAGVSAGLPLFVYFMISNNSHKNYTDSNE